MACSCSNRLGLPGCEGYWCVRPEDYLVFDALLAWREVMKAKGYRIKDQTKADHWAVAFELTMPWERQPTGYDSLASCWIRDNVPPERWPAEWK